MRVKESRHLTRISTLLVATVMSTVVCAQSPSRPKLVVGVMIEGLTMDQLDLLRDKFGQDGFNRVLNDGVTVDNIDYGASFDPAASATLLYSGASPAVSGVDNGAVYDLAKRHDLSAYNDPSSRGIFTDLTLSPRNLLVSNLADEVRLNSDGVGSVHSIALSPEVAIAMSGHAANSAVWINDVTGSWASTSYYKDFPIAAQQSNHFRPLAAKLDTLAWTPSVLMSEYPDTPGHRKVYPFRVTFAKKDVNRYKQFVASAPANTEVTSLAQEYIKGMSLGKRDELDMLNLHYTVAPYPYAKDSNTRVQQIDSYLRLDRDLANLFSAVEHGPGMANTLIFIAGTPAPSTSRRDDEKWGIPYGEFSVKRAQSLLNSFLMAKFGNGEWVNAFRGGQVYLNRQLIKQRGVDIAQMREEAAKFIAQMAGVTRTTTLDDILSGHTPDKGLTARANVAIPTAADIYVSLAPGWETVEINNNASNYSMVARVASPMAPFFILYPQLKSERITTPVDARSVAPTVASQLRIRAPNGADASPIPLSRAYNPKTRE